MLKKTLNAELLSNFRAKGYDYDVIFPEKEEDFLTLDEPFDIIGNGTNTLLINEQDKALLCMKSLSTIQFISETQVYASAGVILSTLVHRCRDRELSGLEFTYPVPATLGGAVAQNFGAYEQEISSLIDTLHILDLNTRAIIDVSPHASDDINTPLFSYRHSIFKTKKYLLLGVTFNLQRASAESIEFRLHHYKQKRSNLYPIHHTCGSIFKNPHGDSAGRLLDIAGVKSYHIGGAHVCPNHANVIICEKATKAHDVFKLVERMQEAVHSQFNIILEPELVVI